MEFYLKHIQGNVLSLQVAEASIRVGKKPHQNQLKTPQRRPYTVCFPSPAGWSSVDLCSGGTCRTFQSPTTAEPELWNCRVSPCQCWVLPGTLTLGGLCDISPAVEILGFSFLCLCCQVPPPSAPWLGFHWFPSPAHGRGSTAAAAAAAASLFLRQRTFISAPASPCPWVWNMVTQNYSTLEESPARQQCLLPSHSSGACKCNDSIPQSWPVLTLVVRGLEFQKHFWCFLKS